MGLLGGTATDRPDVFTQEDERLNLGFHKLPGGIPVINQGVYHVSRQIGLIMAALAFDRSGWRNRNENSVLDIDDAPSFARMVSGGGRKTGTDHSADGLPSTGMGRSGSDWLHG
jgi:hypothetical protein